MKGLIIFVNSLLLGFLLWIIFLLLTDSPYGVDTEEVYFIITVGAAVIYALLYAGTDSPNTYMKWSLLVCHAVAIGYVVFFFQSYVLYADLAEQLIGAAIILVLLSNVLCTNSWKPAYAAIRKLSCSPYEARIYEQIGEEIKNRDFQTGLLAKATALSNGRKERTESIYIKLRYKQLRDELRQEQYET